MQLNIQIFQNKMKNKYSNKNIQHVIESCNDWCCPCNEGNGCQANNYCSEACENAFFNKDSKWNKLLNEAYLYMNTDKYDSICKEIYDFAENEYN